MEDRMHFCAKLKMAFAVTLAQIRKVLTLVALFCSLCFMIKAAAQSEFTSMPMKSVTTKPVESRATIEESMNEVNHLRKHWTFTKLNARCSVYSNGQKVRAGFEAQENVKLLEISDFECAALGLRENERQKVLMSKGCVEVSDFCSVCADGGFKSRRTGRHLKSDLYECASGPRTVIGGRVALPKNRFQRRGIKE
jgi:hypothetical protein